MADATVTRYELSLGAQDATTGWPTPSYASSSIDGSIQPRGFAFPLAGGGFDIAKYAKTFYTADVIARGDLIKDAFNRYYAVTAVEPYDHFDQFSHYQCALEQREPFAAPTTTSGTWHLDSDALTTDPRSRHKIWLDDNLTADNMELDDGATNADVKTMFAGIPYYCPAEQLFLTEDYDGVMAIDKRSAQQLTTYNHYPYAFLETVPIHCSAIDKAGLTATNLLEQMEQEIRHVCTDHPLGSIRSIDSTEYKSTPLGGTRLWETTVTIRYKRANDDYTTTYPRITYGASGAPDGTFYFPNCISVEYPDQIPAVDLMPVGSLGQRNQRLGDSSITVKLRCDLDVNNTTYDWKRPQTIHAAASKTDSVDWEILWQIKHDAVYQTDEPYQTLSISSVGPSMQVTLDSYRIVEEADMRVLEVTFKEYNASTASEAYTTRWGLT